MIDRTPEGLGARASVFKFGGIVNLLDVSALLGVHRCFVWWIVVSSVFIKSTSSTRISGHGKIKESLPINSPCESPYFYYCHLLLPTRFCVEI